MLTRPNLLRRAGQLAALFVMAILGLADLSSGMVGSGVIPLGLVQVGSAVATAAVWLPAHRQGSTRLPKVAMLLAGFSLLLTILLASSSSLSGGSFGTAETLGLLG